MVINWFIGKLYHEKIDHTIKKRHPLKNQMDGASVIELSQFVEIFGQFEHDLFLAVIFLDNDAGNADAAAGLDGVKLGTIVTILEELLEGQHACGNVDISKLDVSLGKSLFHRGTAGSMHAGIHNDLLHIFFLFHL